MGRTDWSRGGDTNPCPNLTVAFRSRFMREAEPATVGGFLSPHPWTHFPKGLA